MEEKGKKSVRPHSASIKWGDWAVCGSHSLLEGERKGLAISYSDQKSQRRARCLYIASTEKGVDKNDFLREREKNGGGKRGGG